MESKMGRGKVFLEGEPAEARAQGWAKCGQERACEDTRQIAGTAGQWKLGRAPQQEGGGCRGWGVWQSQHLTWSPDAGPPHPGPWPDACIWFHIPFLWPRCLCNAPSHL